MLGLSKYLSLRCLQGGGVEISYLYIYILGVGGFLFYFSLAWGGGSGGSETSGRSVPLENKRWLALVCQQKANTSSYWPPGISRKRGNILALLVK